MAHERENEIYYISTSSLVWHLKTQSNQKKSQGVLCFLFRSSGIENSDLLQLHDSKAKVNGIWNYYYGNHMKSSETAEMSAFIFQ